MTTTKKPLAWVKLEELPNNGGRFIVSPLDRGMGITLGNAMRRVLLSSLGGYSVVAVKIKGVKHEFSTIPHVVEDVLDVIFNLKKLVFKSTSHVNDQKRLTIKTSSVGNVTAADFKLDGDLEIINKDQHIAQVSEKGGLEIDVIIDFGIGFTASEINKDQFDEVDLISIDSSFSPVLRVNHQVEKIRVGKKLDHDSVSLDVWTDGSITAEDAVKQAAAILLEKIALFNAINEEPIDESASAEDEENEEAETTLSMSIDDLELTARSSNCLKRAGIESVGELVEKDLSELIQIKNFGKKSADEINDKLKQFGLVLKGDI